MVGKARALLLGVIGALFSACSEPAPPPPSIIFFSVDTLGARHLSAYGYDRATSPFLETWATDEAILFEHCVANAPWTTPSYVSQFTGLYPRVHRLEPTPGDPRPLEWVIPEGRTSLAEHLSQAGYRTAAFVDNPLISSAAGFAQGFDLFDTAAAARPLDDPDGGVRDILPRVMDWLDGLGDDEPFFLFVNVLDVHGPYHPIEPWKDSFASDSRARSEETLPVAAEHGDIHGAVPLYIVAGIEGGRDAERLPPSPIEAAYDEQILAVDAALEKFVTALRERGTLDESVFVLSADHGESFGEHDTWFCHQTVFEPDLHVPLVIRMPGARGAGRRVPCGVQLVDLFPTLAELAGSPFAESHGRSLVPLLDGEELPEVPRLADFPLLDAKCLVHDGWKLVLQTVAEGEGTLTFLMTHRTVRDWVAENHPEFADEVFGTRGFDEDAFKRTVLAELRAATHLWEPRAQLFDLRADPREQNDLADEYPEKVAELRELLEHELERVQAERDVFPLTAPELDEAALDAMRDLGYVDD